MSEHLHKWGRKIKTAICEVRQFEAMVLFLALTAVAATWAFAEIADEVIEGETQRIDEWVIELFRHPEAPGEIVGPRWVATAVRDLSALGSSAVLTLMVLLIAGFLLLAGRRRSGGLIFLATFTGGLLAYLLKGVFARQRPVVVPHLDHVTSASFPSGHSMLSAVVYLTIGGMLANIVARRRLKVYALGAGILLSGLVGLSRIILGVHYPTDVLSGWAAGLAWAFVWVLVGRFAMDRSSEIEIPPNGD